MPEPLHLVCPACLAVNRVLPEKLGSGPVCGKCRAPLTPGKPVALTAANFDKLVLRGGLPVLVDFWAPWCGPCKMMGPAFEQAAAALSPHMLLAKCDTQDNQEIGARFGIRSIPTMALFAGGREVDRISGAMDTGRIVEWARSRLGARQG